jgi:hypothetical protein
MADEVTTRLCLPDDIEAVLELWQLAGSTSSITDTSGDLWEGDAGALPYAAENSTW